MPDFIQPQIGRNMLAGTQGAQQAQENNQMMQARQQRMQQMQADQGREDQFRNELASYMQGGPNALAGMIQADPMRAMQTQQMLAQQDAQQNELLKKKRIDDATTTHTQAQTVLNSKAPATYFRILMPDRAAQLASAHGKSVDDLTDEEVKAAAEQTATIAASQAGIIPVETIGDVTKPQNGIWQRGPDGTLKQVTAPLKPDTSGAKLAETTRHNKAMENKGNQPADEDNVEKAANAISNYQQAPLGALAMRSAYGQAVMAKVMEINPDYQANEFGARSKAYKDFASGKQGTQVASFNRSFAHLDTLSKLSEAMSNGDVPLMNKLGNAFASHTGKAAPVNFDAAKKVVADEIVKAIVGSGGGVADREEAARTINNAASPAQLSGVIETYKELIGGQLSSLQQQYEQSTGRKDFKRLLSPEVIQYSEAHPIGMGNQQQPPAQQGSHPPEIQSLLDKYK
jgi:hypothetical protein